MLWSSAEVGAGAEGLRFAQGLRVLQEPGVTLLRGDSSVLCVEMDHQCQRRVLTLGEVGGLFQWVCFQFHP